LKQLIIRRQIFWKRKKKTQTNKKTKNNGVAINIGYGYFIVADDLYKGENHVRSIFSNEL
jgi:hypothetical protein